MIRQQEEIAAETIVFFGKLRFYYKGWVARHGSLGQEPARLDVVAVGDGPRERREALVEEEHEVPARRVEDPFEVQRHQRPQQGAQPRRAFGPQQVGVGLHQVKVGVHRLGRVLVLVAQAHVGERAPVARTRLEIAAALGVPGVRLERLLQRERAIRSALPHPVCGARKAKHTVPLQPLRPRCTRGRSAEVSAERE